MKELQARVQSCKKCNLHISRERPVFGSGDLNSDIVIIGEAPGEQEDIQGMPFVGRSGEFLNQRILEIGLRREHVYICNIIKCRPPKNRDPSTEEVTLCSDYLIEQLNILKPKVIITLGKFSGQFVTGQHQIPISRLRGCWFEYNGISVMPTFHPAYCLRNSQSTHYVKEDFKAVIDRIKKENKLHV